jgi:hypothetical protein
MRIMGRYGLGNVGDLIAADQSESIVVKERQTHWY